MVSPTSPPALCDWGASVCSVLKDIFDVHTATSQRASELLQQKACFADTAAAVAAINAWQADCCCLDVGGQLFTTTRATMTSHGSHVFSVMGSEVFPPEEDEHGRVFIDRDSRWFSLVLAYLRHGVLFMPADRTQRRMILREATYFGVDALKQAARKRTCIGYVCEFVSDGIVLDIFDPSTKAWETRRICSGDNPEPIASCVADGYLYIAGRYLPDMPDGEYCIDRYNVSTGVLDWIATYTDPWLESWMVFRGDYTAWLECTHRHVVVIRGSGKPFDALDLATLQWHKLPDPDLGSIDCSCVYDDRLIVVSFPESAVYVWEERRWELLPEVPHPEADRIIEPTAVVLHERLLISGGWDPEEFEFFKSVYAYDFRSGEWSEWPSMLSGRSQHAAVALGDSIFFFAGQCEGEMNEEYNVATQRSTGVAALPYRSGHAACAAAHVLEVS